MRFVLLIAVLLMMHSTAYASPSAPTQTAMSSTVFDCGHYRMVFSGIRFFKDSNPYSYTPEVLFVTDLTDKSNQSPSYALMKGPRLKGSDGDGFYECVPQSKQKGCKLEVIRIDNGMNSTVDAFSIAENPKAIDKLIKCVYAKNQNIEVIHSNRYLTTDELR